MLGDDNEKDSISKIISTHRNKTFAGSSEKKLFKIDNEKANDLEGNIFYLYNL